MEHGGSRVAFEVAAKLVPMVHGYAASRGTPGYVRRIRSVLRDSDQRWRLATVLRASL